MVDRAENINSSILEWARVQAGLSTEDAAERLGLTDTKSASAIDKLIAFEEGARKPTRSQLLKFASVYKRPLVSFYRTDPPEVVKRGEDFRQMTGQVSDRENALLDALLRDIRARQDMVRALLEDDEDVRPVAFIGSLSLGMPVEEAASVIRQTLRIDGEERRQGSNKVENWFDTLRSKIEALGVFVLLIGDLGSHHSKISTSVFRGFAISDAVAPFIVINDQDAAAARPFTLIHELVHLFLGQTGISAAPSMSTPRTEAARIERYCNDVAGVFWSLIRRSPAWQG